jgi:hypothetical protein
LTTAIHDLINPAAIIVGGAGVIEKLLLELNVSEELMEYCWINLIVGCIPLIK